MRCDVLVCRYTSAAQAYAQQLTAVQSAFHTTYWNDAIQTYGDGTQAALTYPLYLNAVPAALDAMVFDKLVRCASTHSHVAALATMQ